MPRPTRVLPIATMAAAAAARSVALGSSNALATVDPGTPANDVHFGQDNDNASNPFVQPHGVSATLHMNNTDVMFGRDNDDLLVGRLGSDTLLGGSGSDILIGGPDQSSSRVTDVMVGDKGDDWIIWSPRDGNEVFAGDEGQDTAIFAPLVKNPGGSLRLDSWQSRTIPRVTIDKKGRVVVHPCERPAEEAAGRPVHRPVHPQRRPGCQRAAQGRRAGPVPEPERAGKVLVADLREAEPHFDEPLALARRQRASAGAIIAPASLPVTQPCRCSTGRARR